MSTLTSPVTGTVVSVAPVDGVVPAGAPVVVVESMKMEYEVPAPTACRVEEALVAVGDRVAQGDRVATVSDAAAGDGTAEPASRRPDGGVRADLLEVLERHRLTEDEARPEAVARRRDRGQRTARENVQDLMDPGSFVEYGPLVVAAQRSRRSLDELRRRTPADGLVAGIGTVDGVRTAVLAYDATVLAGTQGHVNHHKKDRLFDLVARESLPVVFFTEGGGGRPGDTDAPVVSGLDVLAFERFARLSGRVPLIGIASGRCFAGNAALLGCCDVIVATEGTNIGMGGPAMVEGAGLGAFAPEAIGPLDEQVADGVVDVAVRDEGEAARVARRLLSLLGGDRATGWTAPEPEAARAAVPENRRSAYDVHAAVDAIVDVGSALELRAGWSPAMVTALATVEGRPVGVVANNPAHGAGAIDADGADKAARFLQLCDAHGVAVLFLCDTPGFMVGPDAERDATVRHVARMFVVGANLRVPFATVILRKAYGLGAMAMAGGTFAAPLFCVAWPTGEVGGMGLEGAVRLGFRDELAAVSDPAEREQLERRLVDAAYDNGRALNAATYFELDDVIDPADSRRWITTMLTADRPDAPAPPPAHRFVDPW